MHLRHLRRLRIAALLLALAGLAPPCAEAGLPVGRLREIGKWALRTMRDYAVGKGIDYGVAKLFPPEVERSIPPMVEELKRSIPPLVEEISNSTGEARQVRKEQLAAIRDQLELLSALSGAQEGDLAELRSRQERILTRVDALEARVARLEGRVDHLEDRVSQLEDALIAECLDLRAAPRIGEEGFHVLQDRASVLADRGENPEMTTSVRVYLNACSPALTERGLLIQLSLATRGLRDTLKLTATLKDVATLAATGSSGRSYYPYEFDLGRPAADVDGQVQEIFLPYADFPYLSGTSRYALALVVTHDGDVEYVLTDRVLTCTVGRRTNCRWVR